MFHRRMLPILGVTLLGLAPQALLGATGYLQHNLVADTPGIADLTDPNAVNIWGIAISATSPFWVCDGGTGLSTVYTASATALSVSATKAAIPPSASGGNTVCTGIVANSATTSFLFGPAPGRAPSFIFATEGGTISSWANAVDATHALITVDNSASGAVYKGLALVTTPTPQLYVANFHSGTIDVFDAAYKPVTPAAGAFTDPAIPAGFAPFNIQNLGGSLYVTYAKQDANKKFDVSGLGNGYVDVYDPAGKLLQHLVAGGTLNSPWGVQIAPANFGQYSNALLVGNFGDGLIHAFDTKTGALLGTLQDQTGKNIQIPGLWGLQAGNGGSGGDVNAIYFAAGPTGQTHGLFGSIQANPVVTAASVVNAATAGANIAANTWVTIYGANLSPIPRAWTAADIVAGKLPTSLAGVSVTVNGAPAYLSFVNPKQINLLTPTDMQTGSPVQVVVSNNGLTTSSISVPTASVAPSFFLLGGKYVAATHSDGRSLIGPTTLFPNASTPAAVGETIVMYGNGFGGTNPGAPNGQVVTGANPLLVLPGVTFDGIAAQVVFAGLTGTGVFQLNVTIPAGVKSGDSQVVATAGGVSSPTGTFITVQ